MEPGWYPDPFSSGGYVRWWDGQRWGASTSVTTEPGDAAPPPAPPPPAPAADPRVAPIPLATWPQRAVARIIDAFLEALLTLPFVMWLIWPASQRFAESVPAGGVPSDAALQQLSAEITAVSVQIALLTLAVSFVYQVPQNVVWGRTLGKRALRLRIRPLRQDVPLTWLQATVRWGTYAIGSILTQGLFAIVDYLWPLWDRPWRQALHDKAARTIVVPAPPPDRVPAAWPGQAPPWSG